MNTDSTEGEQVSPQTSGESGEASAPIADDPLAGREDLQLKVKNLLTEYAGEEKWPRRVEVIEARLQRFFERGDQYVYWNAAKFIFATVSQGLVTGSADDATDMPRYMDVYNIYEPYEETILSLLSQNPVGVTFKPEKQIALDIAAAQDAEYYRQEIDRINEWKNVQTAIARNFCTDGRTVILVEEGKFYIYGVLEHKCPITARLQAEMPYQFISDELHIDMAKYEARKNYPDAVAKIKPGPSAPGESNYERLARLGAMQGTRMMMQSGDAWKHLVTRQRAWLRPCALAKVEGADGDTLRELFPDGMRVTFIGDAYCGSQNISMDKQLVIRHPTQGDGQNRPSLLKKLVPVQRAFNDYKNLEKEIHDYTQPRTFMACDIEDIEALREQVSEPGNTVPFELPANVDDIHKAIFTETPSQASEQLVQAYTYLQQAFAEFITGCYPALFGGDTKANDTLGGIAIQRDQSMMRMGLPWGAMQEMMAEAYELAIRQAAEGFADDEVKFSITGAMGRTKTVTVSGQNILNGNFRCYPDIDSSFPETTGAKKQAWQQLAAGAEKNPMVAGIIALPENQELAKQWTGLEDVTIPGAAAMEKQYGEIDELLKTKPVPPSKQELAAAMLKFAAGMKVAATTGGPIPQKPDPMAMLKPTIGIEQEDFHQFEYQCCQDWLSSPDCRKELEAGNQAGVLNVRLHARMHQAAMQAMNAESAGKKVSESINFADLPPDGQVQMAAQAGIKIQPPAPKIETPSPTIQ